MHQPLVAVDIGASKVACAIGLPHEASPGFELLGTSLVPCPTSPDGWLQDPLLVSRLIEQALDAAVVTADVHRALVCVRPPHLASEHTRVVIGLADEPITVRGQDLKRLQARALDQIVAIDREPLLIERLACAGNGFDGARDPRGMTATRLSGAFHVVTLPIACRRAVVQAMESAGLEVAQLSYTLPAAFASAAEERLRHQRVLLVDVGGLTTDAGLFVEGHLHALEVLPWGGLRIAAAIAADLHVTMEQAVTWSLEGMACRKAEVKALIRQQWESLQQALGRLLAGQPKPDAVLACGRGALIDGFVEWLERGTGVPTALCRSPRTSQMGDVSRQVGVSPAIGLLELATRQAPRPGLRSPHLFDRVLDRTRVLLTEYF